MKEKLNNTVFKTISTIAEECNIDAYVIGGFVRDLLLSRDSKDIDIVVIGSGIEIARKVAEKLGNLKVTTFKNFGTAMIKYRDLDIEFVGARKESYNRNSRKPIVEDGTLEDDQNRRDFTINALALSLNNNSFGKLIDPFNGLEHLKQKVLKTPLEPTITFSDDPLRMMRAVRFASQLNFNIDEDTFNGIRETRERISIVSKERITDELNKILLSDKPSVGFKLLDRAGLLQIILPELHNLKGVEVKNGISHKDNFYHTLEVVDRIAPHTNDLWLRWATLLHDIGKPASKRFDKNAGWTFYAHNYIGAKMTGKIFNKLKLPLSDKMKFVKKMVKLHMRPISLSEDTVTDSAVRRLLFEAGDDIDSLMTLCEADITSKNAEKVKRYMKNFEVVRQKLKEIEQKDHIRNFQPPVSGEIIMETFALKPCREIGDIKSAIKEAILDGVIRNDYDKAYEFMLKKGEEMGLKPVKEKPPLAPPEGEK